MCLWVIVPVKPFNRAKSRLAPVLSPTERERFAERMFRHTLEVIAQVPKVSGTLVVSRDTKVLAIARDCGAKTIQESGTPELNAALTRASEVISAWGCNSSLVMPADLPLIAPEDIMQIIELGRDYPSIVIATDPAQNGTNVLYMRPPGVIPYTYGEGSYVRHIEAARKEGVAVHVYESERLMLDIDVPEDLTRYTVLAERMGMQPLHLTPQDELTEMN